MINYLTKLWYVFVFGMILLGYINNFLINNTWYSYFDSFGIIAYLMAIIYFAMRFLEKDQIMIFQNINQWYKATLCLELTAFIGYWIFAYPAIVILQPFTNLQKKQNAYIYSFPLIFLLAEISFMKSPNINSKKTTIIWGTIAITLPLSFSLVNKIPYRLMGYENKELCVIIAGCYCILMCINYILIDKFFNMDRKVNVNALIQYYGLKNTQINEDSLKKNEEQIQEKDL